VHARIGPREGAFRAAEQLLRVAVLAELRHRDPSERERSWIVAHSDEAERAECVEAREVLRSRLEVRVHRLRVAVVTPRSLSSDRKPRPMKAHGIECCHGPGESGRGWARGAVGGVLFAVLAALMPKCPMCIVAWLGVIGLSGLAVRVDPRALWLAAALAVGVAGAAIVPRLRRGPRPSARFQRLLAHDETKKSE